MENATRNITKIILQYDTGVPGIVIIGLFIIMAGSITMLYVTRKDYSSFFRNMSLSVLMGYASFILCATLLFREKTACARCYMIPFASYDDLYYKMIAEILLNVLFFIPIGFLIAAAVKQKGFLFVLCTGCMFSLAIETAQLLCHRGICNIDDVFHNTLGCAIGYVVYRLCKSIQKIFTKRNIILSD